MKVAGAAAPSTPPASVSLVSPHLTCRASHAHFACLQTPAPAKAAPAEEEDEVMSDMEDEDDDEELDLFGEATEEEKAARQKVIDDAKKRGEAKAKLTKSMIVLDVKPWDDQTGALTHGCRSGLLQQWLGADPVLVLQTFWLWSKRSGQSRRTAFCGAPVSARLGVGCVRVLLAGGLADAVASLLASAARWQLRGCTLAGKLVPVGYGIKKMQITAIIEDAKVESMDAIIEEELVKDGESESIQSIDVVSFNKL